MEIPELKVANPLVMTKERFCEVSGVDTGVLRGWIEKELIPTVRIGKHRLVNLALFERTLLEQEFSDN